jgi:hypothetical protein
LWFDPVTTQLYIRYDDDSRAQWVIAVNNEDAALGIAEISRDPPRDPIPGTLWFDPIGTQLYVYYDDGESRQWVIANNFAGSAIQYPIPIEKGGTGADNARQALANLGGAPIISPYFLGTPTAPTPPPGTNNTRIATTAFVTGAINLLRQEFLQFQDVGARLFISATPPPNPRNSDMWFDSVSTQLFVWYNVSWVIAVNPSIPAGNIFVSNTPPPSPQPGNLWFDSVSVQLYVWFNDQWVVAVNPVMPGGGDSTVVVGSSPPENPQPGLLWFDSVSVQLYTWFNDHWVVVVNPVESP